MMTMIEFLIVLLVGYYLGTKRSLGADIQKGASDLARQGNTLINNLTKKTIKPGPVKRPDAPFLNALHQDPQTKAANQAMTETLDNIPELAQNKKGILP